MTHEDSQYLPSEGDFSVCFYCGAVCRFYMDENNLLQLRTIVQSDMSEIAFTDMLRLLSVSKAITSKIVFPQRGIVLN
jgi:hypothetical protein